MKIDYSYDDGADILYITFGKPINAICHEVEEGILLRRSPKTQKIVGITIIDFSKITDN